MDENIEQQTVNTEEQTNTPEYTPIQLKAIDQGWIPREEFDGDESEFIDAAEFVRRGELFKKIETQSREVKQLRQALEALKQHQGKIEESAYNRALKQLQEQRKAAFIEGEHEKAFAIEEQIANIQEEKQRVKQQQIDVPANDEYAEQFRAWVDENSWYESNSIMRKTADTLGLDYHNQGYSPAEVLKKVSEDIKREFSHKFKTPAANRPSAVEAPSRSNSQQKGSISLSADERKIMTRIVASGIMTEAEYMKQLKDMRKE